MLEIKVSEKGEARIIGDGTSEHITAGMVLAIIAMAKFISENNGMPLRKSLVGLMGASLKILDDHTVDTMDGHAVTMPDLDKIFGKEGAGEDA